MKERKTFWDKNAGRYDRFMRKDRAAYDEMYELIQKLNREGITIIMVSHDTQAAAQYANKVLHVSDKPEFFDSKEAYLKSAIGRQYADYATTREEGV